MADKVKIMVWGFRCERCGYEWVPKKEKVKMCPRCKSRKWDTPYGVVVIKREKEETLPDL